MIAVRRLLLTLALVVACSRGGGDDPSARVAPVGEGARVVSLTPSATEVVAALGAASSLVGVDDYSTYPPEVQRLPKVGSFLSPNLETIIGLQPTLVIVDDVHGRTAAALADAHVPTVECAMHDLPDVKKALALVGGKLGKTDTANLLAVKIDGALAAAAAARPAKRARVLIVIDREAGGLGNLVAAGTGTYVDELLAVVGGENVLAGAPVRYPKISLEEVLRAKPDVILDLSFAGKDGTAAWDAVDVPAVARKHVVAISAPYLTAPSPRVDEALAALTKAIAP